MLIKSERLRTSAGHKRIVSHLTSGDENEEIIKWHGETSDVADWYSDAARYNRTYAVRHWIVSPFEDVTNEQIKDVFADLAKEFGFDLRSSFIREHGKARAVKSASSRHWHVLVPEVDAATGKVMGSSNDFIRHEKLARLWEHRWGLRPVGGAHNKAVVSALRFENRHDVAAWMEEQFSGGEKPRAAIRGRVHQALKRTGIDASIVRVNVRKAWEETSDSRSFHARLASHELRVRFGDRRWIVETMQGAFVGIAPSMVGAKTAEFTRRMQDGAEKEVRRRTGSRRNTDDKPPSQETSAAPRPGGASGDRLGGYNAGTNDRFVEVDAYSRREHRQTEHADTGFAGRHLSDDAASLSTAAESLVRQALPHRNTIAVMALSARLLARPPLERAYDALELAEALASESIKRSEIHLSTPLPEPPKLRRLRGEADVAKAALDAARIEEAAAQAAVAAHRESQPGLFGWATGARKLHAQKLLELEAHLSSSLEAVSSADRAWAHKTVQVEVAVAQWKPEARERLRQIHLEARDAKAEMPIFATVRTLLRGSPVLAYRGPPWLMEAARRLDAKGNGLAVQDMWGVGIVEPSFQPQVPR